MIRRAHYSLQIAPHCWLLRLPHASQHPLSRCLNHLVKNINKRLRFFLFSRYQRHSLCSLMSSCVVVVILPDVACRTSSSRRPLRPLVALYVESSGCHCWVIAFDGLGLTSSTHSFALQPPRPKYNESKREDSRRDTLPLDTEHLCTVIIEPYEKYHDIPSICR